MRRHRSVLLLLAGALCLGLIAIGPLARSADAPKTGPKPEQKVEPRPDSKTELKAERKVEPKTPVQEQGRPPAEEKAGPPESAKPELGGKVVTSPILTAKLAMMADPRLFPYEINVELEDEGLLLSGTVAEAAHKTAAGEIVERITKQVDNQLEVDPKLDEKLARRHDEAITQYVKDRFAKSMTLSKADFGVKTERGIVSLSGKTRFQVIVLEAAEAARHVPGVKAVKTDGVQLEGD